MKIALLHKPGLKFFSPDFFSRYFYNFFYLALPRSKRIEYKTLARDTADVDELNQYDVVILFGMCEKIGYIPIPTGVRARLIANAYDSNYIKDDYKKNAAACGVKHFFYHHCPKWFYSYAPADWKYCQVQMVLEPSVYQKTVSWEKRNAGQVLLTGMTGEKKYYYVRRILRDECRDIVKYVPLHRGFSGDKYSMLLNGFRAHVAACTVTTVNKYVQSLAAGCFTFAECNNMNGWESLGLVDGVNCIAINSENCIDRIREYLADRDNPRYADIAAAGRRHAMENLNNDVMVNRLIDWIERELA